jgi:hypothetical protein
MTFDIAKTFNDAVTAAVEEALAPLRAQVADLAFTMAKETKRIDALDYLLAKTYQDVTMLQTAAAPMVEVTNPLTAPIGPIYTDTFEERVGLLEDRCADLTTVLGAVYDIGDLQAVVEAVRSGSDDWVALSSQMTARVRNVAVETVEQALEEHEERYDHDDFISDDSMYDAVRRTVRNLDFSVSVD